MTRRPPTPPVKQQWQAFVARHRWWFGGGAAALLAILAWALWPSSTPPPPRARQYINFTACLLTGERGISDPDAAPVWNGLQQASLATKAKVQYLAVTGQQTVDNAVAFVATLAQTRCNLIFAAGDVPVASVNQAAPTFPNTRFLIVHGTAAHSNVSTVDGQTPDQIAAAVAETVTKAIP